jgi:hypothetical protein
MIAQRSAHQTSRISVWTPRLLGSAASAHQLVPHAMSQVLTSASHVRPTPLWPLLLELAYVTTLSIQIPMPRHVLHVAILVPNAPPRIPQATAQIARQEQL